MPLYIRDDSVDAMAEKLRRTTNATTKTEAVRTALLHELQRIENAIPLRERVKEIQDFMKVDGRPLVRDFDQKAFSDSLFED